MPDFKCAVLLAASILWLQALTSHAQVFIPTLTLPLDPSRAACGQACVAQAVKDQNIPGRCASGGPHCFCSTFVGQDLLPCTSAQGSLSGCNGVNGSTCCPPEGPCCDDFPVFDPPTQYIYDQQIYTVVNTAIEAFCNPSYNYGPQYAADAAQTPTVAAAAALLLPSSTPTNTSNAAAPASRKLLQSLPKFGDVSLAFYLDYVVFNVTLTNLDVLFTAVPDFGDVTMSHMHVQGGNSSTHLAYFVDAPEGDSIELPRSGDYLLASGELSVDEFDVPDTNMSLTEYVLGSLSDIFADIHTTRCQAPCEALRGIFITE